MRCPVPESPDNGRLSFASTRFQAVATAECDYGFVMVGAAARVCGRDGQWTGPDPVCKGEAGYFDRSPAIIIY